MELTTLRRQLKKQRATLSQPQQRGLAKAMVHHLHRWPRYRSYRHIAIYIPVRGEADPRGLLQNAPPWQTFYLPVLSPWRHNHLIFIEWNHHTRFKDNKFGIPEPVLGSAPLRHARQLDAIITPLVAFDPQGNRMGMGGGFYDRTLAFKHQQPHPTLPQLIGYAYQFQGVKSLPAQPWDVPLNTICTELGLKHCNIRIC